MLEAPEAGPREEERCVRDLVRLLALPDRWQGRDLPGVAEVLLDEVVAIFALDLAWVRLADAHVPLLEQARSARDGLVVARAHELGRRIEALPEHASEPRTTTAPADLLPGVALRVASAPIGIAGESGLLVLGSDRPDFPTATERLLIDAVSQVARVGLRSALLQARIERAAHDRELLHRISDGLSRATRPEDVFGPALDGIRQVLGTERAAILLHCEQGPMRFVAWRGLSEDFLHAFDAGPSPWDAGADRPIVCVDAETCPELAFHRAAFRSEGIGSIACVPLVCGERVLGSLMVCFDHPHRFDERDVQLAQTVASDVAQALGRRQAELRNSGLVADLQRNLRFNELFVGILGHDLRNPLFAIKAAAWLISRRYPPDPVTNVALRISESANRMSRMIDQILDFTRLRLDGEIPLTCATVDLYEIARAVADELHTADGTRDLALSTSGLTSGEWDRDRLAQLLSNLLGNAYQHARPGTRIEVAIDGTGPGGVSVEIRSEGAIAPDRLSTLFEPLRARTERTAAGSSGLGLGLYICRRIALAHGGSLRVESEAGVTRFVVHLPRRLPVPECRDG